MQDDRQDHGADGAKPTDSPMTRFPLLTAAFCIAFSAAVAQDTYTWDDRTRVTIQPSNIVGAEAEVVFLNTELHSLESETFELTLDGLTVTVTITPDRAYGQPDLMTVEPPPGFIAIPPELIVPENAAGRIVIYQAGMM